MTTQSPIDTALGIKAVWTPPFKARDHEHHQAMLRHHAAVKQERVERRRKERVQGKPRAYAGNLF